MRLDQWLVKLELISTRSKAQQLIKSGAVQVYYQKVWKKVLKPGFELEKLNVETIRIEDTSVLKYVSRAGLKLDGAIDKVGLQIPGKTAIDLGTSTGGFVDCLIQGGIQRVVGIDVGTAQLAESLRNHDKFHLFENTNARDYSHELILGSNLDQKFDLLVCDLSFISLDKVLSHSVPLIKDGGEFLCLVKPQFELTPSDLNRKGLVKDVKKLDEVREKVTQLFHSCKLSVKDYFESSIEGTDGNKEFFIYAIK